jgi:broad specificity phosphatase PhoE
MEVEIVLLRHGKPQIRDHGRVSASGFGQWIAAYNRAGIDPAHHPSPIVIEKAKSCSIVICSHLPRSIESAAALGAQSVEKDSMFRECDMPYANLNHPKLPVSIWSVVFRMLQVLSLSPNAESFKEARERANNCAFQLSELARQHGSVLLVGHGLINLLISKQLFRMGWRKSGNIGRKYWGFCSYRLA